jgi:LPXTG-motif cell wall-anchored protein
VSAVAGVAVAALAAPALAHVEVSADKTRAGATDVTLTFNGEAENPKAGIASERVVLPTGIAPADVTLVKAPAGWKFTAAADGFTVGGKALKTGTDAVWKVKIAKLPDGQTRLSFKTLETYGNGDISRWIEIQQPGQDEPDNPAPLLTLKPGAAAGTPAASSAAASPSPSAQVAAPATTPAQAQTPETTGGTSTWWIWVAVVVLVVAAGILFLRRRRRTPDTE